VRHISIEGMDGVGKSTVCNLLAQKLGFEVVYQPLRDLFMENYVNVRNQINQNDNRVLSSWFYGLGSVYMYEKYKSTNIVTDRHLCSNYAWSGTDCNKEVYKVLIQKLGKPELTVILYAPESVIKQRLLKRNKNDSDLAKVSKAELIYKKMISFCTENDFPFVVVDTSSLTPEQIVNQIIQKL